MDPIKPPTPYPTGYVFNAQHAAKLSLLVEQAGKRGRDAQCPGLFRFHVLGHLARLEGIACIAGEDWTEAVGRALKIVEDIQDYAPDSHAFRVLEDGLLDWVASIHKASHANLCQMLRIITNRFAAGTEKVS